MQIRSLGIVSDAVHIFLDTLSIIFGMISILLPFRHKLIRTRAGLFNIDDVLTFPKKTSAVRALALHIV